MASTMKFTIPSKYESDLKPVKLADNRTNHEILNSLAQHVPVESEKNVWAFWDKGLSQVPEWCQRNICDWVRILSSGDQPWTVRVLDSVPDSPNYALKFLPGDLLPQSFVEGDMQGPYVGPHSADFLRGALLYLYGGVSIDVGCLLLRHLDRAGWSELEDPESPYNVVVPLMYGQTIANHYVMARKGDPFIKRWHELFVHFWKGRKDHHGICDDSLLAFSATMSFDESRASKFMWEFAVEPRVVFDYIGQVMSWTRLTMLEDAGDGFSCSDYWQHHILTFDVLKEDWGMEEAVGFMGEKQFELLALRMDADSALPEYKEAEALVWRLLSQSTMQKIQRGKGLTKGLQLGRMWDMPENREQDCAPGTFAELLRYGSVHFQQTREKIVTLKAQKAEQTMKKGVLEP